jgi:predicted alpha-1,2-mannosidase
MILFNLSLKSVTNPDHYLYGIWRGMKRIASPDLMQMDQTLSKSLYRKNGYVPYDISNQSVSKTLEYAYDDWCIAQMARSLKYEDDYQTFNHRSDSFKNVFDATIGLMRGKSSKGIWREPFNPYEIINHQQEGDYAGANALQNLWFVPHDILGLIDLLGGRESVIKKLDFFFDPKNQSRVIAEDVAGFVGFYAQGNETDHHAVYLYNYVGQSEKTQAIIRWILTRLYNNSPAGLTGNEDCGQMSAWYIFNVLGFYPVNPCGGIYNIGSPWVKNATINLDNGNQFKILTENQALNNKYIQEMSLNGQPYDKLWISHQDIMKGGTLVFTMGENPNSNWENSKNSMPPSLGE